MPLGIIAKWRGQPLRLGPPTPRAPLSRRQRPAWRPLSLCRGLSTKPTTTGPDVLPNSERATVDEDAPSGRPAPRTKELRRSNDPRHTPKVDDLTWEIMSQSPFVKPAKQYYHPRLTRESQRNRHKTVVQQIRQSQYLEYIKAKPTDWRQIYEWLYSATDVMALDWVDNGLKITLPRWLARELLSDAGDYTIAAIGRRTKAVITIPTDDSIYTTEPSAEDMFAQSDLLVSGSRGAINSAIDQFRRAAGGITITRLNSPPEETGVEAGEEDWAAEARDEEVDETLGPGESRTFNERLRSTKPLSTSLARASSTRRWIDHHVDLTAMPSTWTTTSFQDYVKDLVDTTVLRHLHSRTYTSRSHELFMDHERAVINRLLDLFNIAPATLVSSCSALKIALKYICEKGPKYFPQALRLVANMEKRGFRLDTQVFNTLLVATIKMANPDRFFVLVKRMIRSGYKADLDTWLLFLRLTHSPRDRAEVLRTMRGKNLLATPEALRSLAKEMAASDMESAAVKGESLESFLGEQKARYGPNWLTRVACNAVVDVLCCHGRFDDAFRMLDLMMKRQRSIPPERIDEAQEARVGLSSFNIILWHAETIRKMPLAINTQRKLSQSKVIGKSLDPTALNRLFEIAWKARLRSSMVAIWRYASLARLTTHRMRKRVARLLYGKIGHNMGYTWYEIHEDVYRSLGGEALARELAGGPEALARIRALAEKIVRGRRPPFYPKKLAVLAAKALALAFPGQVPAVEPGEVVAQSALVDRRCLRARKHGQLYEELRTARVKTLPLIGDGRNQDKLWVAFKRDSGVWVRTLEGREPLSVPKASSIKHNDVWEDRWESEGWTLDVDEAQVDGELAARVAECNRMAIIDPRVWADDDPTAELANNYVGERTDIQIQNEKAILEALETLESQWAERRGAETEDELWQEEARDISELEVQIDDEVAMTNTGREGLHGDDDPWATTH